MVPADRNWVRDVAVARLLHHHLAALDPQYPKPDPATVGHRRSCGRPGTRVASPPCEGRQHISSGSPWELIFGYSRAVAWATSCSSAARRRCGPTASVDPDPLVQARRCMELIEKALMEAGGRLEDIVPHPGLPRRPGRLRRRHPGARRARFGALRPANTTVIVSALANPLWRVEIEVDAVIGARVASPPDIRNIVNDVDSSGRRLTVCTLPGP